MSDKLKQAITHIKAGRKAEGKQLLIEILNDNEKNHEAWLWMSAVVEGDELKLECLQEVLKLKPDHSLAQQTLKKLEQKHHQTKPTSVSQVRQGSKNRSVTPVPMIKIHHIIITVGFTIFFIALGIAAYFESVAYQNEGQIIDATLVSSSKRTYNNTLHNQVIYEFTIGNTVYKGHDDVSESDWNSIRASGQLQVQYLPRNPNRNQYYLPGREKNDVQVVIWMTLCGGVAFTAMSLYLFVLMSYQRKQNNPS